MHVIRHVLNFCQGWTRVHTYFVIMGGFFDSDSGSDSEQSHKTLEAQDMQKFTADSHPEMFKLRPPPEDLSKEAIPEDLPEALLETLPEAPLEALLKAPQEAPPKVPPEAPPENPRPQPWTMITESEILDKSKGDALGKLVTVLQTTWFIAQYLDRWSSHQPRTQLEVMTLAYAALNVMVYALWWKKPLGIQEPIDVRRGRAIPADVHQNTLWGSWIDVIGDSINSPGHGIMDSGSGSLMLIVVGVLFGGVHCFAWSFPFPTEREAFLWKFCALYCTTCPVAITAFVLIIPDRVPAQDSVNGFGTILFIVGYIVCRIILFVLTFTSLRAEAPGIYEATVWTFFFPHVG